MLKDNGDKIAAEQKSKIEEAAKAVREALKGTDIAAIRSATEKLNEAWQAASADMYRAASEAAKARGGAGPGPTPSPDSQPEAGGGKPKDEGPIIDAEVVDDKK